MTKRAGSARGGTGRRRWTPGLLAGAFASLVAACGPSLELPEHGTVRLATPDTAITVAVPPAVRGTIRQGGPGLFRFGAWDAVPATSFGSVSVEPINAGIIGSYGARLAGRSDAERLAAYLAAIAPAEQARPAGPASTLRSYVVEGRPRPEHAALGIACSTRRIVAEERGIPGQARRLYLTHRLVYTCIDPLSGEPVELTWSERFRVGTHRLSPGFDLDAERFFASLRFQ